MTMKYLRPCNCLIDQTKPRLVCEIVFITDWYDGVVEALLRCSVCARWYLALSLSWDLERQLRVFAILPVTRSDVKVLEILRKSYSANCRVDMLPSPAAARLERCVERIVKGSVIGDALLVVGGSLLCGQVLSHRHLPFADLEGWLRRRGPVGLFEQRDDVRDQLFRWAGYKSSY